MAKKNKNTLLFVLLGALVLLVGLAIWRNKTKPKGEKVEIGTVEKRTIRELVSASGKIYPQMEVKISSDVSGELVELLVEEGDSVRTGQLLAKVDPDSYLSQVERGQAGVNSALAQVANSRASIESSKAQREQLLAQLVNTKTIHARNEKLRKEGVISEADLENSLANLRALEANVRAADANIRSSEEMAKSSEFQVKSAQATLNELRTSLRRTSIYAPTNGIVSNLPVEKGERVLGTIQMNGTEIMRIADLKTMEVRVDVSENDIPRVTINDEVDVEVDAYLGKKFKGFVTQIAHSASSAVASAEQVTNFEVRITIDPASYAELVSASKPYPFRPGMSASVSIYTETVNDAVSVPIQAVTTRTKSEIAGKKEKESSNEEPEEVVFVVSKTDSVKLVRVKTGIQDDSFIQILEGLKLGDEVVKGPYATISRKLKQGDKIVRDKANSKDKKE